MVDFNLEGIASGALNVGILIVILIVTMAVTIGLVWMWQRSKKYSQFTCIIFEKDGLGNIHYKTDKGGIFVDKKTNNKRLFLKKANVGLNADNVPFIGEGSKRLVYLFQTGLKNFRYVSMAFSVNPDGEELIPEVGEEDLNWAINAYERQKKIFSQSMLMQMMPYMALAFTGLIIMIIFIYFFKDFAVLKDVAEALRAGAQALAQASTGTKVI